MKRNLLALIVAVCLPVLTLAQSADDDMYYVPKKKTETKDKSLAPVKTPVDEAEEDVVDADADYHTGQLRDVDEYNRRGSQQVRTRLVGDTLYVVSDDGEETIYADVDGSKAEGKSQEPEYYYYDDDYDDFHYAVRLRRYHGVYLYDPFYADFAYGWYNPWYYSWYDPWCYSWHGHWHSPWYGGWYGGFTWGGHHHGHGSFGYAGRTYRSISHPVMRGGRTGRTTVSSPGRGTPRGTILDRNIGRSGRSGVSTSRSSGKVTNSSGHSSSSRGGTGSPRGSSVSTPRGGSSVGSGSMGGSSRGSFGGSRGGGSGRSGGVRGR